MIVKKRLKSPVYREPMPRSALGFSQNELALFGDALEQVSFTANESILVPGETENYLYFIVRGFFKAVHIRNTKPVCTDFGSEGTVFCSFASFLTRKPSLIGVQALSKGVAYRVHYDAIYWPSQETASRRAYIDELTEAFYLEGFYRDSLWAGLSAQQRYQTLLADKPAWLQHVPVKDLATYLGIHPESLSRLRREIYQDEKRL